RQNTEKDALLLARSCDIRRVIVKGTHGHSEHHFIHHTASQERGKVFQITNQRPAVVAELFGSGPLFIYKADDTVAQLKVGPNHLCELNGSAIRADNQHVARILSVLTKAPQPSSHRNPSGDCEESAHGPEYGHKIRRDHAEPYE